LGDVFSRSYSFLRQWTRLVNDTAAVNELGFASSQQITTTFFTARISDT